MEVLAQYGIAGGSLIVLLYVVRMLIEANREMRRAMERSEERYRALLREVIDAMRDNTEALRELARKLSGG